MKVHAVIGAFIALWAQATYAKAVFAHFMVGNVIGSYDLAQWQADVELAKASGLTGFVLNAAPPYSDALVAQFDLAFAAAGSSKGFENIISFDYTGGAGAWPSADVTAALRRYGSSPAYFHHEDKPLVTTFEGSNNIDDWVTIKSAVPCFLVPDWSSLGPEAFATHIDIVDGVFSWEMWPTGANDMTTTPDNAWKAAAGNKTYMMGVSPWFYTNLPQYNKSWVWRGDDLWADRWEQVQAVQPDSIQVVSWNDYGESHYIGPISPAAIVPGAESYVDGAPHDHWRDLLPYYTSRYLKNDTTVKEEKLTWWYRLSPGAAGSTVATGNNCPSATNAFGHQDCVDPNLVAQDKIFFTALLASVPANISVQIGGGEVVTHTATMVGVNHFSQPFGGQFGNVTFEVVRECGTVMQGEGWAILEKPADGVTNYNAYTGGASAGYLM